MWLDLFVVITEERYGGVKGTIQPFGSRAAAEAWARQNLQCHWTVFGIVAVPGTRMFAIVDARAYGGVGQLLKTYIDPCIALKTASDDLWRAGLNADALDPRAVAVEIPDAVSALRTAAPEAEELRPPRCATPTIEQRSYDATRRETFDEFFDECLRRIEGLDVPPPPPSEDV